MTTRFLSNCSLFASLSEVPLKNGIGLNMFSSKLGILGSGSHLGPKLSKLAFSSRRIESKMPPSKFLLLGSSSQVGPKSSKWTCLSRGIESKMFPPKFRPQPPVIWFENLAILSGAPPTSDKREESLDDAYKNWMNIGLKPWKNATTIRYMLCRNSSQAPSLGWNFECFQGFKKLFYLWHLFKK